jgi:hypothetical protein
LDTGAVLAWITGWDLVVPFFILPVHVTGRMKKKNALSSAIQIIGPVFSLSKDLFSLVLEQKNRVGLGTTPF